MLGKFIARLRKTAWDRGAASIGAFASRHQDHALRGLFVIGLGLVVLLVHREVFAFIAQRRQFSAPPIKTAVAPQWSNRQGQEIVRIDGAGRSLFDPQLVEKVGKTFEACPWVRKVTAVERIFPDQLVIKFEYRRAHVAVRRENGFVLVDRDGVRLPGVYTTPPACERPVQVTGIASLPPEPGQVWKDESLNAAVMMADYIPGSTLLGRLGIREVDVANYGGRQDPRRSEMSLVTSNGCVVAWGRTSATSRFGDLSTEEKLENLREVLAVYPDLNGLKRVTLYFRGSRAVEPTDSYVQSPPAARPLRVR
ncbi:MAG TPA: hypothetical protein VG457_16920 [Planctomycetota bacterium]|jgi:hypothetical protein|nr:hypothetical protein [Planctomycetota bacterium]